jgi:hypothetical protein
MSSTVVVILVGSPATASDAETDHALSDSKVMLVNEYGKDDNIKTIRDHLLKIVGKVEVVDVTISNTEHIIKTLSRRLIEQKEDLVALNLCDGLEDADGYPVSLQFKKQFEIDSLMSCSFLLFRDFPSSNI